MKRLISLFAATLLFGIVVGASGDPPPSVLAQACGLNADCPFGDGTVTSSLTVDHGRIVSQGPTIVQPVEPDTGETWQVVAKYRKETTGQSSCDCDTVTFTATVDVDWNGSGWTATCTSGCVGPINAVDVCLTSWCSGSGTVTHGSAYELIVDLDNNIFALPCAHEFNDARLYEVAYTTTSVDDGFLINSNCTLGSAVSPTSQTWAATDTGAFECPFNCNSASGPSVSIRY